jgi:predicted naringenin-chalcone synthase
MSKITNFKTLNLEFSITDDQFVSEFQKWIESTQANKATKFLANKIAQNTDIKHRQYAIPPEEIIKQKTLEERMILYKDKTRSLCKEIINKLEKEDSFNLKEVDFLISTSCTGYQIPNFNSYIINNTDIKKDVINIPISLYGCTGWTGAMILAHELTQNTQKKAIIINIELSSINFIEDVRLDNIVSACIFTDGVSLCVVNGKNASPMQSGFTILKTKTISIPAQDNIIGYRLTEKGFMMDLSKELPSFINDNFEKNALKFLEENDFSMNDIAEVVIHAAGKKIINDIDECLKKYNKNLHYSTKTLQERGNMSSATLGHTMEAIFKEKSLKNKDKILVSSFGPGFTMHFIIFEYVA